MKLRVALLVGLLCLVQSTVAQTNTNAPTAKIKYFSAKLPGGTYTVALSSITSVSSHTYVVDGAMQVTEACISDTGTALARFYFVEPLQTPAPTEASQYTMERFKQLTTDAASRLNVDTSLTNSVVKNYPLTTHARTVEYRMPTKDSVEQLRKAAEESFLTSTTKTFEIK